jgi:hypothetical protein
MATIQGIQFENDANGNPQFIKIDLEKYGTQLRPFLKKVGVELEKDAFDLELENAISSEAFLKRSIDSIKKLPWKKQ